MNLLDSIIDNTSAAARVVSEQHDTSQVNYGGEDAVKNAGGRRPSEPWDAGEYGMSLATAQAKFDAAQTPEAKAKVIEELKQRALRRASLDVTDGKVSVFVAGKPAWHGLGVQVDKAVSSREAIKLANLSWEVKKHPLYFKAGEQRIECEGHYALVRQDTLKHLGVVGEVYKPIQNQDGFDFLDSVLEEFGASYETAGACFGGKQVWLTVNLPRFRFAVNGRDSIEPHAVFFLSHDGTKANRCFPTADRPVCANTLRVAIGKDASKGLVIRHTGNVKGKINDARNALGLAVKGFGEFKGAAETMAKTTIDVKHYANDVLDAVLEVTAAQALKGADALAAAMKVTEAEMELERKRFEHKIERRGEILEDILERYESRTNGVAGMRGTTWAAFNSVTEHADHNNLGRQVGTVETRRSRRFESALMGPADEMKQAALEVAMAATR